MIPSLLTQLQRASQSAPKPQPKKPPVRAKKTPIQVQAEQRIKTGMRHMQAGKAYTTDELGRLIGIRRRDAQSRAIRRLEAKGEVRHVGERKMPSGNHMLLWMKV